MTDAVLDSGPLIHLSELDALDIVCDFSMQIESMMQSIPIIKGMASEIVPRGRGVKGAAMAISRAPVTQRVTLARDPGNCEIVLVTN